MSVGKPPLKVRILAGVSVMLVGFKLASAIFAYFSIYEYKEYVQEATNSGIVNVNYQLQFFVSVTFLSLIFIFSILLLRSNNKYRYAYILCVIASQILSLLTSSWSWFYFGIDVSALLVISVILFSSKASKFYLDKG